MPSDCCYFVDKAATAGAAPALKHFGSILHCFAVFTQNLGQTPSRTLRSQQYVFSEIPRCAQNFLFVSPLACLSLPDNSHLILQPLLFPDCQHTFRRIPSSPVSLKNSPTVFQGLGRVSHISLSFGRRMVMYLVLSRSAIKSAPGSNTSSIMAATSTKTQQKRSGQE